ncbi:MAG: TIR domain-containing protein [Anaerolineae bacterium]|nr:MAG: TIR domain-containing protein [Anaerolineae bacterium]
MSLIFINYRHEDSKERSEQLAEKLKQRFGQSDVFIDEDIPGATGISESIKQHLESCEVMIIVIGKDWKRIIQERQPDQEFDPVVFEIEYALTHKVQILPCEVDHKSLPKPEDLPPKIRDFIDKKGVPMGKGDTFDDVVRRLIDQVAGIVNKDNLPEFVADKIVTRDKESREVIELLANDKFPIVVIYGDAGIGKSALAHMIASEGLDRYRRVIWMSSKDKKLSTDDILNELVRIWGVSVAKSAQRAEILQAVKSYLQRHKALLIIDNFETIIDDEKICKFLEELPNPTKILITSRVKAELQNAQNILLQGMSKTAVEEWLHKYNIVNSSWSKTDVEREVNNWHDATGGNPHLLKLLSGQAQLRGKDFKLVKMQIPGVLDASWGILTEDARKILLTMPILSAPACQEAIGYISGLSESEVIAGLKLLVRLGLLDSYKISPFPLEMFSLHPTTRDYAGRKLKGGSIVSREFLCRRMFDFYCGYVEKYQRGDGDNFEYLTLEIENIKTAIDYGLSEKNQWEQVLKLLFTLSDFLDHLGYWQERVVLCKKIMNEVKNYDNTKIVNWFTIYHYAWTLILQSKRTYNTPRKVLEKALEKAEEQSFRLSTAMAKRNLAVIALEENEYDEADTLCEDSIAFWDQAKTEEWLSDLSGIDYRRGKALTFGTRGNIWQKRGKYGKAYRYYEMQKEIYDKLNDPHGLSVTLANLTVCAFHRELPEISQLCEQTLEAFNDIGRREDGRNYLWSLFLRSTGKSSQGLSFPAERRILLDATERYIGNETALDICAELTKLTRGK